MLVRILVFYAFATSAAIYAVRRGGQPERLTACMLVAAAVATSLLPGTSYRTVVWPLLVIDVLLLLGLTCVAAFADRFWPMYFSAIQLVSVTLHGVRAYDATILPVVYARLGGELAYPTLLILVLGTWRHARRTPEPDWSWQTGLDGRGPDAPDR